MAKKNEGIKTYTGGTNLSMKQIKMFMGQAKTAEERKAVKELALGEPLYYYGKQVDEDNALQTDLTSK